MTIYSKHIISTVLLVSSIIFGQFSTSVTINTHSDDNLFRTPDPVQDLLSNINVDFSYQKSNINTRIYNNTNLITYKNISDRNFLINTLGLNKGFKISEKLNSNFNFGGNWSLRVNQENYDYYNYSQLSGYANYQLLTDFILIKSGYSYRWRDYSNFSELSNNLHNTFLQINKSFPTRTTIIAETSYGNKSFLGQNSYATISLGGRGHGRRETENTNVTNNPITEELSTSQVNITLRITQSLLERVGVYMQYSKQISLDDETSYRNIDDFYQDDELFDDPFTYESDSYSSQMTIMLPKFTKLMIGGSLASKDYISEPAFSTATDSMGIGKLRLDDQSNYFIDLSKIFHIKKDWVESIKFNLYYSYTNNESNSYWYNYKNTSIGGGIQWSF